MTRFFLSNLLFKMEKENSLLVFIQILLIYLKQKLISLINSIEICCLLKLKFGLKVNKQRNGSSDIDYCYLQLNKVSRSFSFVIQQLPDEIRDIICIFYLVLRGLDTIEDDPNVPIQQKRILLKTFHEKLFVHHWSIENIGDNQQSKDLLTNFHRILNVFQSFDVKYQRIIVDITKRMADGMIRFVESNDSIETLDEYNLYCHYVAGLVGHGLSQIFVESHLESKSLIDNLSLSNSMGLFLQKTNIIRDYLEDLHAGRIWWPKQIWNKYVSQIDLLSTNPTDNRSVECLNEMICDALTHLPDVLLYLNQIQNEQIFRFCAIPQLMALATLEQLYSNPKVFTSIVKIRKGLSAKILFNSSNIIEINRWIQTLTQQFQKKIIINNHLHHPKSIYQSLTLTF